MRGEDTEDKTVSRLQRTFKQRQTYRLFDFTVHSKSVRVIIVMLKEESEGELRGR